MTQLQGIASNAALRATAFLACGLDVTALVTAATFRLRLKMLSSKGEDERFAEVIVILYERFIC
jgi:hypothetical protein